MSKPRTKWTDEKIATELNAVIAGTGIMPSAYELRGLGRNDLACALSKRGGFLFWAERLGVSRVHSDSDTGWDGEKLFVELAQSQGIQADRSTAVKAPYDVLLDGILRVDVKSANYAEYGPCRGWFYRIGKIPQADIIVCLQLDTRNFYGMPWTICPRTNVTIAKSGGRRRQFLNNWPLIRERIAARKAENERWQAAVA
jgi:hypothetical protein